MHALNGRDYLYSPVLLVLGLALFFGCISGCNVREGMYYKESSRIMTMAQLLGIIGGAAMAVYGAFLLYDLFGPAH